MTPSTFLGLAAAAVLTAACATTDAVSTGRAKTKPDVSQGATVSQTVGIDTLVAITYHRPGVKGRDVWNDLSAGGSPLVPRDGDPTPWRAGANESTTLSVTGDVTIEGQQLSAGTYILVMIPTDDHWTLILQDPATWEGRDAYDPAKDALRVDVQPEAAPHGEWLSYGFDDAQAWSTRGYLHWAELKVPFRIEVAEQAAGS